MEFKFWFLFLRLENPTLTTSWPAAGAPADGANSATSPTWLTLLRQVTVVEYPTFFPSLWSTYHSPYPDHYFNCQYNHHRGKGGESVVLRWIPFHELNITEEAFPQELHTPDGHTTQPGLKQVWKKVSYHSNDQTPSLCLRNTGRLGETSLVKSNNFLQK